LKSDKMPKAYIAAPFSSKMENKKHGMYGEIVDEEYKTFLKTIESIVKDSGFSTFLPHRDTSSWGTTPNINLDEHNKKTFEEIASSDLFVVYPERSRGVCIELGWAIAHKKKIVLLVKEDYDMGLMLPALSLMVDIDMIKFKDITDLKSKLKTCLDKVRI